MKTQYYTIGQIFRLGLLKNHKGEPYKDKATVSRIVSHMKYVILMTVWGKAKTVSMSEIRKHNKKW